MIKEINFGRLKKTDNLFIAGGFRLCGGDQRAMKTDEVCDRPVETFGYKNAGAGANPVPRLMNHQKP